MRTFTTSILPLALAVGAACLQLAQPAHAEPQHAAGWAAGPAAPVAASAPSAALQAHAPAAPGTPGTASPATPAAAAASGTAAGAAAAAPPPSAGAALGATVVSAVGTTAGAIVGAMLGPKPVPTAAAAAVETGTAAAEKPKSKWLWPLESAKARVSSFFGALRGRRAHGGVDISTPVGTPVKATDSGIVVASTNRYLGDKKYGEVVVIEHLNGFKSLYAHLNARDVKVGDEVKAGQEIGQSGQTGHSTGPHLHLEAFYNGARTDPGHLLTGLQDIALPSALNAKQYSSSDGSFVTKAPYVARAKAGKTSAKAKAGKTSSKNKAGKATPQKHIKKREPKSSRKSGRK